MTRRRSAAEWVLRAVAVLGLLAALLATGPAGVWPQPWLVVVVGLLALTYAVVPETVVGTVAMGVVLCWWAIAFHEGVPPEALLGATGLVASHVAGILVSYGPPGMAVDPATVRLWVRRGAAALALAPLSWLIAEILRGQPEPDGIWVAGLAATVLAVATAGVAFWSQERDA